jgi:hypothetical protein
MLSDAESVFYASQRRGRSPLALACQGKCNVRLFIPNSR